MLVAWIEGATESPIVNVLKVGEEILNEAVAAAKLLHNVNDALVVPFTVTEGLQGPSGLTVAEVDNDEL